MDIATLTKKALRIHVHQHAGLLTVTKQITFFVVVMTDRYSNLTTAFSKDNVTASIVATNFLKHWVVLYGVSKTVFINIGSQFVSKFSAALCASLGTRLVATTEYSLQSSGRMERKKHISSTSAALRWRALDRLGPVCSVHLIWL